MNMKKGVIIGGAILIFLIACVISGLAFYNFNLMPIDSTMSSATNTEVIIENGTTTSAIIATLKEKGLIKNELVMKIYAKLHPGSLQAGRYILNSTMNAKEIYKTLMDGKVTNDTIWVTFVEGKTLSYIASQIANNFGFDKTEVESILDDKEYIKELITKHSILSDSILNEKIYHPLEGYLFCDTYEFEKTATIKDIVERMIETMESNISKYNEEIEKSPLNIHELLTLASIIELEGARSDDRKGVSGVFYNRLNSGWTLGSDVTTYYAVGKTFQEDLSWNDLNTCNGYNTRSSCVSGLPVGPIAAPSIESIEAAIEPKKHDYFYFVADKNGKTYFNKTESEHNKTINELKAQNMWFTYN